MGISTGASVVPFTRLCCMCTVWSIVRHGRLSRKSHIVYMAVYVYVLAGLACKLAAEVGLLRIRLDQISTLFFWCFVFSKSAYNTSMLYYCNN